MEVRGQQPDNTSAGFMKQIRETKVVFTICLGGGRRVRWFWKLGSGSGILSWRSAGFSNVGGQTVSHIFTMLNLDYASAYLQRRHDAEA